MLFVLFVDVSGRPPETRSGLLVPNREITSGDRTTTTTCGSNTGAGLGGAFNQPEKARAREPSGDRNLQLVANGPPVVPQVVAPPEYFQVIPARDELFDELVDLGGLLRLATPFR